MQIDQNGLMGRNRPVNWERIREFFGGRVEAPSIPEGCDLFMVRSEIAQLHSNLNEMAASKGGAYYFKNDYVSAWTAFRDNPTIETAKEFLRVAPAVISIFRNCSPGADLYETNWALKDRERKRKS